MSTQACRWRTFVKSHSGTTLPAAFYPSPESSEPILALPRDVLRRPRQAPRQLRSNAEILTLRQARCTRLDPCPRFPILVLPRSGPYPSPWPSSPCVLDIIPSSSTMHSCIRILPRLSIPSIPAPCYVKAPPRCVLPILRLGRLYLAFSIRPPVNASSYPCPCLNLDVPEFPMLYPRQ